MAKVRLIPKLLLKESSNGSKKLVLVITRQYDQIIEIGSPVSMAKIYQAQGADELIFTNIRPETTPYAELRKTINAISEEIFMPITVGGGISTVQQFRELLTDGADKISINTAAINNPSLIQEASEIFGAQCVVVGIDYRKQPDGSYMVYSNGGKTPTHLDPVSWAVEAQRLGAGEILLTSIENDGMRNGMDNVLNRQVCEAVSIPVIVSGGCSLPQHFIDAVKEGKGDAVAAGTFFAFKDQSFMQVRSHIHNAGIDIRVYT
ncbi:MAG: imidazole glycerol phosphate synthase subunit HisF [Chitinophagaceae bacterium]|nr:MAG: imidazole glycerol phosphate synthase subunit HisF [Chitinophagaceae bacterium]